MRNLQKILALALALIMSFSLVVTANAAFSDEADINETYSEAVNVLSGLEVFRGYTDGSYQPQASITRAEVAAIIYRIATGDVEDRQVSLYSDYNRFTDVASGSWYAGYVNYCANAEYIKGYDEKRFGPNDPVTGYQALAMILRAVGYGKMDNEFEGSNWAVQTAARANTLGVSKNVTAALLGSAATREVVAELLFRSILVPTVEYNQFNGYTETDTTLGAKLGLEEIEGVVVANERANLYGEDVLAAGKTELEIAENDIRSLDYVSGLTDIGESRYAYIRGSEVLALADTGKNVSKESGAETDISTDKKFRDFSGLTNTEETEYYVDFGREGHYTSDYRIEFTIEFTNAAVKAEFEKDYDTGSIDDSMDRDDLTKNESVNGNTVYLSFEKVIRAETEISQEQLNIIKGIFAMADDTDNSEGVTGEVYVGTRSTDKQDNRYDDLSDTISYRTFYRDYINSEDFGINWDESENGEWVKIIDNNADGKADYAFKTHYYLDKVISSYTKSGEDVLEYYFLDLDDYDVIYDAEVAVNDIVLYTLIDNQAIVEKPEMVSDQIKAISFKDVTVTTDSDNTYGQSGIFNKTKMDEVITNMDEDVDYNMYLDKYGYIRAYELAAGTKYALLSELYYGYYQNGRYVTNNDLTVELTAGEEKTEEFDVLNEDGNDFVMDNVQGQSKSNWRTLDKSTLYQDVYNGVGNFSVGPERNVLQPATAHLALDDLNKVGYEDGDEYFSPALTNVARYVKTDDGVRISSAAQYSKTTQGEIVYYTNARFNEDGEILSRGIDKFSKSQWVDKQIENGSTDTRTVLADRFEARVANGTYIPVYTEDYIELDKTQAIAKKERKYDVAGIRGANNEYVNAVHDTEYYIVSTGRDGKITYFVDYEKVPEFKKGDIEAIYAVAHNTVADRSGADYWVADVIVIQVNNWTTDYDSISLAFYNPYEESTRVRNLDTLNNEHSGVEATVIPGKLSWGTEWKDYGFYRLYDTSTTDNTITAEDINVIGGRKGVEFPEEYEKNGIFAGTIVRRQDVNENGGYLVIDKFGGEGRIIVDEDGNETGTEANAVSIYNLDTAPIYGIDGTAADSLRLRDGDNSEVMERDQIIWVEDNDGDIAFIIDITDSNYADGSSRSYDTPSWLKAIYSAIIDEQRTSVQQTEVVSGLKLTSMEVRGTEVTLNHENRTGTVSISKTDASKNGGTNYVITALTAEDESGVALANTNINAYQSDKTTPIVWHTASQDTNDMSTPTNKPKYSTIYVVLGAGADTSTYTITVTILPDGTDSSLKSLSIKGHTIDLANPETTTDDGSGNMTYTYDLEVSYDNNQDTNLKQVVVAATDAARVTPVISKVSGSLSNLNTTLASVGTAFDDAGVISVKCTAEDGSWKDYRINMTLGTAITVESEAGQANAGAVDGTGDYAVTNVAGDVFYTTTAVDIVSNKDFQFKVVTFTGEYASKVEYQIGAGAKKTANGPDADGVYTIPAAELTDDVTITVETAENISIKTEAGKSVWVNGKQASTTAMTFMDGDEIIFAVPTSAVASLTVKNGATPAVDKNIVPVAAATEWPLDGYNYFEITDAAVGETITISYT